MLKLGYKASAEQFGPRDLLDFSCLAEEVGFDSVFVSDHFQPWKHTDGHAPSALAWLGALGARHAAGGNRHQRRDPDLPLSPVGRSASVRHARRDVPGACRARRRHRRIAERGAGDGVKWPGPKERRDRLREAIALINKLWTEDRVTFEGQFYRTENATIYDKPKNKVPIWVAASGPLAATMAGQIAEGFICTSGKNPQLYTDLTAKVREGLGAARPQRGQPRKDDRGQGVVRHRPQAGDGRDAALGGVGVVARGKGPGRGPDRNGTPRRCPAARTRGQPVDRLSDPEEQVEADPPLCRTRVHASGLPCPGPRPGALSKALCRTSVAAVADQFWVMNAEITLRALTGIKLVEPGDDLAAITVAAFAANGLAPAEGDVLVVAQKIVSKAEGRYVEVATVEPSARAVALAAEVDKDPRFVEIVLGESKRVVRHRPGLMIVEHRRGWVMANAGIDHSNVPTGEGHERVLLLPLDPDASARALREELVASYGVPVAVIISDSFGRPWRRGTVGIAIGAAGLPAIIDWRGDPDLFGRALDHRDRFCRRDRRRGALVDGPGR